MIKSYEPEMPKVFDAITACDFYISSHLDNVKMAVDLSNPFWLVLSLKLSLHLFCGLKLPVLGVQIAGYKVQGGRRQLYDSPFQCLGSKSGHQRHEVPLGRAL